MHPAGRPQLAHPGVDDRESGAAFLPGLELGAGTVVGQSRELGLVVLPCGLGPGVQHVGVELPPGQLGAVDPGTVGPAAREVGEQRARVDLAVLEVDRHPAGAVDPGPVAILGVVVDAVEELLPPPSRRGLAGLGQLEPGGQPRVGDVGRALVGVLVEGQPRDAGRGVDRAAPAVVGPRAGEGGEHLVRVAGAVADPSGRDGVRRARPDQLDAGVGQGLLHLLVAPRAVGAVVGCDVDGGGLHGLRRQDDPAHRVAAHHRQLRPSLAQRGVQRAQRRPEVGATARTARSPERGVEHEERQHVAALGGRDERRVVGQAQVPAEPHHRCHGAPACQRRGTRTSPERPPDRALGGDGMMAP